jgi:hypothetical protein
VTAAPRVGRLRPALVPGGTLAIIDELPRIRIVVTQPAPAGPAVDGPDPVLGRRG